MVVISLVITHIRILSIHAAANSVRLMIIVPELIMWRTYVESPTPLKTHIVDENSWGSNLRMMKGHQSNEFLSY